MSGTLLDAYSSATYWVVYQSWVEIRLDDKLSASPEANP